MVEDEDIEVIFFHEEFLMTFLSKWNNKPWAFLRGWA